MLTMRLEVESTHERTKWTVDAAQTFILNRRKENFLCRLRFDKIQLGGGARILTCSTR